MAQIFPMSWTRSLISMCVEATLNYSFLTIAKDTVSFRKLHCRLYGFAVIEAEGNTQPVHSGSM